MQEDQELLEIEGAADDGVYAIAHAASAMVGKLSSDATFSLDLESTDGHRKLGIEVSFGLQVGRRVIARVGVQVRDAAPQASVEEGVVRDAVERFGGERYANLCAAPPSDSALELDVTVSASSRVRWFSEVTLLPPVGEPAELREAYRAVLVALGLAPREREGRLALPHRRFAAPPDARAQATAFAAARRHGLSATLYSATIPATRALRIAEISAGASQAPAEVQWYLGMGLSGGVACTEADVTRMQSYLEERTAARFGGRRWSMRVGASDTPERREEQPRRGMRFSFWVKGNR